MHSSSSVRSLNKPQKPERPKEILWISASSLLWKMREEEEEERMEEEEEEEEGRRHFPFMAMMKTMKMKTVSAAPARGRLRDSP